MLFPQDRNEIRRFFCEAWRKHREGLPLEPLGRLVAEVILRHPEYHPLLEDPETALNREYLPELGETNPFLHLGLHIAIQEQITTDRPPGILAAYRGLVTRCGDPHTAEHHMMECLGEALWHAQRNGGAPDEQAYLACVRRRLAEMDHTPGR